MKKAPKLPDHNMHKICAIFSCSCLFPVLFNKHEDLTGRP